MPASQHTHDTVSPRETEAMLATLREHFGARLRAGEPLARHGTFGVGGPADAWIPVATEDDLLRLVRLARSSGWPLMLVGNGTNVLYADAGARGIVARMALDDWRLEPVDTEHTRLIAGAGVSLPKLINDLAEQGLAGLEWGAGVPGTIGGAVVSNAGAHGACTADTLQTARVLFTSAEDVYIRELEAAELDFDDRHSRVRAARRVVFGEAGQPLAAPRERIEPPEIITGATFLLTRDEPAAVRERVLRYRQHRKETQPPQPSAGSVFKNPPGDYSGRLIEAAGLKGHRVGKAQISPRHANFIVNTGGATAAEVVALIALARHTVRERFGIELELEVEPRGDW
ncbi:MAG TPA: UDP-N-acetylmuramate dehydrogenase [Ktedonobacterales bacterium]